MALAPGTERRAAEMMPPAAWGGVSCWRRGSGEGKRVWDGGRGARTVSATQTVWRRDFRRAAISATKGRMEGGGKGEEEGGVVVIVARGLREGMMGSWMGGGILVERWDLCVI